MAGTSGSATNEFARSATGIERISLLESASAAVRSMMIRGLRPINATDHYASVRANDLLTRGVSVRFAPFF